MIDEQAELPYIIQILDQNVLVIKPDRFFYIHLCM
jgi:hypothetical protein